MNVAERVAERLALAPWEELFRERGVDEAAKFLGLSESDLYRKAKNGVLGCLKVEGARRRGHGRAGRLTFLLEHLVRYQVEREVLPEKKRAAASPMRQIENEKAAVGAAVGGAT